jgi:hypothetical protein
VGRAIPVRRVRFPSTSANSSSAAAGLPGRRSALGGRLPAMKKLILLVMLVALGVVAAKKVRSA